MAASSIRRRRGRRTIGATAVLGVLVVAGGTLTGVPAAAATTHPRPSAPSSADPSGRTAVGYTAEQALARARKTHKNVQATAATTGSSTLTAHPDGTFTLNQSLAPVRKRINGTWVKLDPTLRHQHDGSISTTASTSDLSLSGGGKGPLATMTSDGRSLAVSLPVALPTPTLSGATAVYKNVLTGVDLNVTADSQGGFSEVLIVRNAKAAANPALKTLALAIHAKNVTVTADRTGDIAAEDRAGRPVFTATAPQMWDSATSAGHTASPVKDPLTGRRIDRTSGLPVSSAPTGPGEGAHQARIALKVAGNAIDLTPSTSLLSGPKTIYPVYIDPTFHPPSAGSSRQAWTQINSYYDSSSYWKSTDVLRVGDQISESPTFTAESFVQIGVPSQIYGSTVLTSQINFNEVWSYSCTATPVQLWRTSGISSSTTWDKPPTLISQVDSQTKAYGHDSSCPAAGVGFDIHSPMQNAADGKWTNITLGLKAGDETDPYGWKEFDNTITVSTTFDHTPKTPTTLTTSPTTSCQDNTIVGDGAVTLYAGVSDPDGGTLGTHFQLWPHGNSSDIIASTNPNNLTNNSGSTAVYIIPKATLENAANHQVTEFDWNVQVTDFNYTSNWSTDCHFTFDPTRPGAPVITQPDATTVGQPYTADLTPTPGGSSTPTSYEYQLNSGDPANVTADSSGDATITVTPTRRTNVLTVTSLSAGANYGDSAAVTFNSAPPTTVQTDGDLTGDSIPDLLTVGGQNNLPSGLWLAGGQTLPGHTTGNGHLITAPTDIGNNGNGLATNGSPSDFNGASAITGHFTGNSFQDILFYYPNGDAKGNNVGGGVILNGNGDGSPIDAQDSDNENTLSAGDFQDDNGDNPLLLLNAGYTSGVNTGYPDLIGVSGDVTNGYALTLYQSGGFTTGYNIPLPLIASTPDGTADWNNWTIATMQLPSPGGSSNTAMFLWKKSTGELDLWENLAADPNTGNLTYTAYPVATNWNKGASVTLQAADINGDGTPDLWTVGANATVTPNLFSNLSTTTTATLATGLGTDTLLPASHAWPLNDNSTGAITTATDTTGGTDTATSTGNAVWETGDQFSPAASFNDITASGYSGTANGYLSTTSAALATNSDFTASAWVDPQTLGTYILGQDGTHTSGFAVYSDAATKTWRFEMPTSDTAAPTENIATANTLTAQVGVWTHLTITYQASTGQMTLYVNGQQAATATHTNPWNAIGAFTIGAYKYNGARTGYFNGNVSDVRTYAQTLTAPQVSALAAVPYVPAGTVTAQAVGDFNGDHKADIAHLYNCGGSHDALVVSFADSNGDGGFGPSHLVWDDPNFGPGITHMAAGDFNGDGLIDLALFYNYTTGTGQQDAVFLLTATPNGGFNTPINVWPGTGTDSFGPGVTAMSAGDFNGDGKSDIALFYNYTTGSSQEDAVFTMTAGGTSTAPTMSAPAQVWDNTAFGAGVQYMGSGDFNGDSKADLAFYYHYSDDNGQHDALFTMTGNGTGGLAAPVQAWNSTTFGPGVDSMAVGDFNGDSKSDIALFYNYSNPEEVGQVALFTTNGSTFNAPTNMWAQSNWGPNTEFMDSGDFNGDGKSDIALYYNYVQQIPAEFTLTADSNGDGGFAAPSRRFADE